MPKSSSSKKRHERRTLLTLLVLSQSFSETHSWGPLRLASRAAPAASSPPISASSISRIYGERPLFVLNKTERLRHALRRVVPFRSSNLDDTDATLLKSENSILRDTIRQLEEENQRLKKRAQRVVGLENFEGERYFRGEMDSPSMFDSGGGITLTGEEIAQDELWCDELDGDECPIEPSISFGEALRDRAYWLVGLLMLQSFSGIILSRNEALLADHPVIIFFLTMLVGAGGNAGNQASVRVIRGLALGTLNESTRNQFLTREFKMAAALSMILSVAGFSRAIFFKTGFPEAVAVTSALAMIVFTSICLGAVLPIILEWMGVDPAHSSTTIQVIMDILGVILAVTVSRSILDGPLGAFLISKLGGA